MADQRFRFHKLSKYPHLMPADVAIWERFLERYTDFYDEVEYDARVGSGIEPSDDWPEEIKRDVHALTQKRIDAVGYTKSEIDIIEIKPRASTSAIGQVLSYRELFVRDRKPALPVRGVIITDTLAPDIEELAEKYEITVIVV